MKYIVFYIITILVLPFAGNALAQSKNISSVDSAQVNAVMNQYFTALVGGDVATLKTLLGGRLKIKRTVLLKNPEYASYLATTHVNADFQIFGIHSTMSNIVSVDVLVTFGLDEAIHKTYTLKRDASENDIATTMSYRIVSEAVVVK